jgi:hypothetical protein
MSGVFEFALLPHNEIQISKNDASLGAAENKDFSAALFGIWFGVYACSTRRKKINF